VSVRGNPLLEWIEQLRAKQGTMRAVAERIGMSESGFVRGAKRGTLSAENLLALAETNDEPPSRVLRLAGKGGLADAIERLYGPGTDSLTASQRELLELWARIAPDRQQPLMYTMRVFANVPSVPPDAARGRSASPHGETEGSFRIARRRRVQRAGAK
jgi:hypothetical protein